MPILTEVQRAKDVQQMFAQIAPRYDLLNRLMTAGQDTQWRREVIQRACLSKGALLLDLGAGTGDLALEARHQRPDCTPIAADFTLEMMRVGRKRPFGAGLAWSAADALTLPFPAGTFDAVVSGFLMRNVTDLPRALDEQLRVLKPGGRIVILDTTRPPVSLLSPLIHLHLNYVIPSLGRWISGHPDAYQYLPASTENFLTAEALLGQMITSGYQQSGFRRMMFGTVAIHWGIKGS